MNRGEKSLVKRIVKKTKRGEINWRNEGEDKFTTEVDGIILTLRRGTWTLSFSYYLDIQNGNGKTSLSDDGNSLFTGLIEKLWELVDRKQGRTFNHSRLISRLATLV